MTGWTCQCNSYCPDQPNNNVVSFSTLLFKNVFLYGHCLFCCNFWSGLLLLLFFFLLLVCYKMLILVQLRNGFPIFSASLFCKGFSFALLLSFICCICKYECIMSFLGSELPSLCLFVLFLTLWCRCSSVCWIFHWIFFTQQNIYKKTHFFIGFFSTYCLLWCSCSRFVGIFIGSFICKKNIYGCFY